MTHTVVWTTSALNRPAEIWISSSDREAAARASDLIDATLRNSPLEHGIQRDGGHRTLIALPIAIEYFVNIHDRLVTVVDVWKIEDGNE